MAYSRTIFIIRGDDALLRHKQNEAFAYNEAPVYEEDGAGRSEPFPDHGTPEPEPPTALVLRITTGHRPQRPDLGFVLGSDPRQCDVVLAGPGIAARHLSVQVQAQTGSVLLRSHAPGGTHVAFFRLNEAPVLRHDARVLLPFETADVSLDDGSVDGDGVRIVLQRFADPADWDAYRRATPPAGAAAAAVAAKGSPPPVYVKDGWLGQGAFAQVFKAVEAHTGQVFAVKQYDKPRAAPWPEPALLQRVRHEHIVRFVAYRRPAHGQPAELVMEYVRGPTLQACLGAPRSGSGGPLPPLGPAEARAVLRQLLQAVACLHAHGVTHRDIKPANVVLVRRRPVVATKLVDFGLATAAPAFPPNGGTPLYMAPELHRGGGAQAAPPCTNKVDLFAVGVVALSLFGVVWDLRGAQTPADCLAVVLQKKAALAAAAAAAATDGATDGRPLPVRLAFALQLLAERPDDRPSAEQSLAHPFFQEAHEADDGAAAFDLQQDADGPDGPDGPDASLGSTLSDAPYTPISTEIATVVASADAVPTQPRPRKRASDLLASSAALSWGAESKRLRTHDRHGRAAARGRRGPLPLQRPSVGTSPGRRRPSVESAGER